MKEKLRYKNSELAYQTYGNPNNSPVLLLHGYLESGEIWKPLADLLSEDFYVICPDIPGHGDSGVISRVHRMDDMAEAMAALLDSLDIKKVHLAGHSMGGYVVMAFREVFHQYLCSFVLFHSTCFADTPEKVENRNREIELVKNGKKEALINVNIPRGFASDNLERLKDQLEWAKEIASRTEGEGIISLLNGMKGRPDRCELLKDDIVPMMLIAGMKDNYIPFEAMQKIKKLGANVHLETLENSGHMGFIEETEKSAGILKSFFLHPNSCG
jgi:pimeloyl-ACP methyl ester carboxylesterase